MFETPDAGQNIITRGLPKTGETQRYWLGCDGHYEAGWWVGRINHTNRQRWIAKTIGGDDIVVDRATGLMWAADGNAAGCNNGALINWTDAIDYCNALNFAGFTDWRLPNVFESASIINFKKRLPAIDQPPFANTKNDHYQSSTTRQGFSALAWDVDFVDGIVWYAIKTANRLLRAVRGGIRIGI